MTPIAEAMSARGQASYASSSRRYQRGAGDDYASGGYSSRGGSSRYGRSTSSYMSGGQGQDSESSSEDDGATARQASRSSGFGGAGGMDGSDLANAAAASRSSSSGAAKSAATAAMARAVTSASRTEQKALNVAESHGTSLRAIARAIEDGNATKLDAQTLDTFADTIERFVNATGRTRQHVENAQDAQEAALQANGGANREEVKSYSLGRGASGRHSGRYRSGVFDQGVYDQSGYNRSGYTQSGYTQSGISRSASRAMSSRGY